MIVAVIDLFSKRQKRARGEMPDVFVYDDLPQPLRVQIVHIITDAFGKDVSHTHAIDAYRFVKQTLCDDHPLYGRGAPIHDVSDLLIIG